MPASVNLKTELPDKASRIPARQLLLRLLKLSLRYRRECLTVVVLQGLTVVLSLSTLGMTGVGIDFLRATLTPGSTQVHWPAGLHPPETWSPLTVIVALSVFILLIGLATAALKYTAAMASAALSQRVLIQVRTEIYARLQLLNFQFYDAGESSSIINRAAGDANAVRNFLDGVVIRVLTVALTLTVFLAYMLQMHVTLTLCCLATTPLLWVGAVLFSRKVQPSYRTASQLGDVMIRTLVENLQGIHVVKGFAREADQAARFQTANDNIRSLKESIFFRVSTFQPLMGLATQLNMLVLIGYGGHLVIQGELALGTGLFVFANLLHEFANQVGQITNIVNTIQSSLTSAERVFEVLDEPIRIFSPPNAVRPQRIRGDIQFHHVTFGYRSEQPVLKDVSFHIRPGERIGITGPTGSGKSTLLNLMKRFYDVDQGSITLDDHDLRTLDLDLLRRAMGIVFQENFLFSNTVAANIAFGDPTASKQQVWRAAEMASADSFIRDMPDAYESMVGEHGSNLSGGQRQRLSLARALLTEPPVLLLDDATAAVDPETEHEIREAMLSAMQHRTTVIVSNRVSTLRQTDRILVLISGVLQAQGTHQELLETCPYYRSMSELQFADTFDDDAVQTTPAANQYSGK